MSSLEITNLERKCQDFVNSCNLGTSCASFVRWNYYRIPSRCDRNREFLMSFLRKPRFWMAIVLVIVVSGIGLWKVGLLPDSVQSITGAVETATAAETDSTGKKENSDEEPEAPPVPVELALVSGKGISAYYRSASVIEADRMVDLVCRKAGQIQSLKVEEGDFVNKGDVLAEVENHREKILLRKAASRFL